MKIYKYTQIYDVYQIMQKCHDKKNMKKFNLIYYLEKF